MSTGDVSDGIPDWMKSPVANLDYAKRSPDYYNQLVESGQTGKCIFCDPEFPRNNGQKVYWEERGWLLFDCKPPRKDVDGELIAGHLVLAPRAHGEEMTDADWLAFGAACRFVERELGWKGYGIGWRVGDPALSGRTIIHRHAHLLLPRQKEYPELGIRRAVVVTFPIG